MYLCVCVYIYKTLLCLAETNSISAISSLDLDIFWIDISLPHVPLHGHVHSHSSLLRHEKWKGGCKNGCVQAVTFM